MTPAAAPVLERCPDTRTPETQHTAVDYEQLFLTELDAIKAAIAFVARRHHLTAEQTEELGSAVYLRLIQDDYAVLRKFQHRSSLRTYLTIVVHRFFLDQRTSQWGKWRPSAAAKRAGDIAVHLEQLTGAQGMPFEQACAVLDTVYEGRIDRPALQRVHARLPHRARRHFVNDDALTHVATENADPDRRLVAAARQAAGRRAAAALARELDSLPIEDVRILKLRFIEGLTIRAIGRRLPGTCRDTKALYRRLHRLLARLRVRLQQHGITGHDVVEILSSADVTMPPVLHRSPAANPGERLDQDVRKPRADLSAFAAAPAPGGSFTGCPSIRAGGYGSCD